MVGSVTNRNRRPACCLTDLAHQSGLARQPAIPWRMGPQEATMAGILDQLKQALQDRYIWNRQGLCFHDERFAPLLIGASTW